MRAVMPPPAPPPAARVAPNDTHSSPMSLCLNTPLTSCPQETPAVNRQPPQRMHVFLCEGAARRERCALPTRSVVAFRMPRVQTSVWTTGSAEQGSLCTGVSCGHRRRQLARTAHAQRVVRSSPHAACTMVSEIGGFEFLTARALHHPRAQISNALAYKRESRHWLDAANGCTQGPNRGAAACWENGGDSSGGSQPQRCVLTSWRMRCTRQCLPGVCNPLPAVIGVRTNPHALQYGRVTAACGCTFDCLQVAQPALPVPTAEYRLLIYPKDALLHCQRADQLGCLCAGSAGTGLCAAGGNGRQACAGAKSHRTGLLPGCLLPVTIMRGFGGAGGGAGMRSI